MTEAQTWVKKREMEYELKRWMFFQKDIEEQDVEDALWPTNWTLATLKTEIGDKWREINDLIDEMRQLLYYDDY